MTAIALEPAVTDETRPSFVSRLVRGRPDDPAWVRPSLVALLLLTAFAYMWALGASGWANSFYSAAVQAGTVSWKAMFFGSSDAANFITVDKPPAALWVMELSTRMFGVSSWSILLPQAIEGVAAVGLLYLCVRRWFTPAAGLIAAAVFAFTPVAVLMFRFNNPDALLVLLLVAAAYATTRAIEKASLRWLVLTAILIGTAFLTKSLQAFLVVPAFALAYVIAAPVGFGRRLLHLGVAGCAIVVASGWWVAIVELWPTSSRPYIGGSQTNSALELIFGYNGFGRLTGEEAGSVVPGGAASNTGGLLTGGPTGLGAGGAGPGGGSMWGATGWSRMFSSEVGGQVSWLLPAAMILLVAMVAYSLTKGRTDRLRVAVLIWGGWLLTTVIVFSYMQGIFHAYYTVALAPAIGAIVGIGGTELWKRRETWAARIGLSSVIGVSAIWAFVLLGRSPSWFPLLRFMILLAGISVAVILLLAPWFRARTMLAIVVVAVALGLVAPAAYAAQTVSTVHSGSIPTAGPTVVGGRGGPGGGPGGPGGGPGGMGRPGAQNRLGGPGGFGAQGQPGGGQPAGPGTGHGMFGPPSLGQNGQGPGQSQRGTGPGGGLLNGSSASAAMVAALQHDASKYTWVAAAVGSNTASGYQLGSGKPVMAIGGFNGSDPAPSLAQFQQYVAQGKIHYFIAGGGMGGPGGATGGPGGGKSGTSSQITSWVQSNFTAQTINGVTVYDLTMPNQ